jgi:hypothetical protein
MSANILQCLRDTAQLAGAVPDWLRKECEQAADRIEALESKLRMIANAFEDWQEPTPGAGREWCERFSTYLRGTVMASACFTPDEWAEVKKWMAPNAALCGPRDTTHETAEVGGSARTHS